MWLIPYNMAGTATILHTDLWNHLPAVCLSNCLLIYIIMRECKLSAAFYRAQEIHSLTLWKPVTNKSSLYLFANNRQVFYLCIFNRRASMAFQMKWNVCDNQHQSLGYKIILFATKLKKDFWRMQWSPCTLPKIC